MWGAHSKPIAAGKKRFPGAPPDGWPTVRCASCATICPPCAPRDAHAPAVTAGDSASPSSALPPGASRTCSTILCWCSLRSEAIRPTCRQPNQQMVSRQVAAGGGRWRPGAGLPVSAGCAPHSAARGIDQSPGSLLAGPPRSLDGAANVVGQVTHAAGIEFLQQLLCIGHLSVQRGLLRRLGQLGHGAGRLHAGMGGGRPGLYSDMLRPPGVTALEDLQGSPRARR